MFSTLKIHYEIAISYPQKCRGAIFRKLKQQPCAVLCHIGQVCRWTSTSAHTYILMSFLVEERAQTEQTDRQTDWQKTDSSSRHKNTAAPTSSTGRIPDLIHNQLCRHSCNVINCRITALYYLHKLYIHLDLKDSLASRQTQATHISKHHFSPPSPSQVGPTQPTWPHAKPRLKINYPNPRLYRRRKCKELGSV